MAKKRLRYSIEFKNEAVSLVLDKQYTVPEACDAMRLGYTTMRRWVNQLKADRAGTTRSAAKAMTPQHRNIQSLEARIRQIEWENDILKKGYRSLDVGQHQTIDLIQTLSRDQRQVKPLCKLFGVVTSSYYYHVKHKEVVKPQRERLKQKAIAIHTQSPGAAGARTIAGQLTQQRN